jgi:ABC-2 type transport system permease protein
MMTYLMPIGFYFMMGFFMIGINQEFQQIIIPAMLVFSVMTSTLMGLPTPLVEAREKGILRSFKINGIKKTNVILIPALTSLIHLLIVSCFIIITAPILFDAPVPESYVNLFLVLVLGSLTFSGISILLGVIAKDTKMTVLLAQAIYLPSMMISGLMVPSEMMPENITLISKILPATYFMEALNSFSYNLEKIGLLSIAVMGISVIMSFGLSFMLYTHDKSTRKVSIKLASFMALPYLFSIIFNR